MIRLPITRGDCLGGPRPCPHVTCRHHLTGPESCALDVADRGGELTDVEVAALMGLSRNGVRLIEERAIGKLRAPLDGKAPAPKLKQAYSQARTQHGARMRQAAFEVYVSAIASGPKTGMEIAAATGRALTVTLRAMRNMLAVGQVRTSIVLRRGKPTRLWALVMKAEAAE